MCVQNGMLLGSVVLEKENFKIVWSFFLPTLYNTWNTNWNWKMPWKSKQKHKQQATKHLGSNHAGATSEGDAKVQRKPSNGSEKKLNTKKATKMQQNAQKTNLIVQYLSTFLVFGIFGGFPTFLCGPPLQFPDLWPIWTNSENFSTFIFVPSWTSRIVRLQ